MSKARKPDLDETTLQIARRMLTMPPKPHDEMKVGKAGRKHVEKKPKKSHAIKKRA